MSVGSVFSECRVGAIGVEISDRVDAWLQGGKYETVEVMDATLRFTHGFVHLR
jgi:hypothetical protein